MKIAILTAIRFLAVTILYFGVFVVVSGALLSTATEPPAPEPARWESGLAVALLFGVFMNSLLLLPNPLMPTEVRMVHLLETATSNFLFGWLVVLILRGTSSQYQGSDFKYSTTSSFS